MSQPFSTVIDLTIDGGDEREICHGYPGECKLAGAWLVPATALAAHASNFQTLTLKAGAGGTALGYVTTDSGDATYGVSLVKGTAAAISLTGTGLNLEFGATDCLEVAVSEDGTTAALDGALVLRWEPIRVP